MENNPFNSSESDDSSSKWEVSDADIDGEEEEKPKKRSLFESIGKNKQEESKKESAEEKTEKSIAESLFAGLLGKEEIKGAENVVDDRSEKPDFLNPENVEGELDPVARESIDNEALDAEVHDRVESVDAEIVADGGDDAVSIGELLADAEFLDNVSEGLHEGQSPEDAIEDAIEQTLENPATDGGLDDVATNAANEAEEDDPSVRTPLPLPIVLPSQGSSTQSAPPGGRRPPPTSTQTLNYQQMNMNVPPTQQVGNVAPTPTPDLVPMNENFNRDRNTGRVIASGIIGYMIGRRGGRKRTEAKLEPVIDKQKNDIGELTQKLTQSEELVKKRTAEKIESEQKSKTEVESAQSTAERQVATTEELLAIASANAETMAEEKAEFAELQKEFESGYPDVSSRPAENIPETVYDQESLTILGGETSEAGNLEKTTAEATENLASIEDSQDRAESNLREIEKENRQKAERESNAAFRDATEKAKTPENKKGALDAQRMTLSKVLEIAEFIPLKNSMNLRQMYEARRIDAVNLRRIVNEYVNGRNYEKTLAQSLDAVELRSELKHEVRQDNSIYKQPEQASHNVVDGIIAATGGTAAATTTDSNNKNIAGSAAQSSNASAESQQSSQLDESAMVGMSTAIIVAVVAGIVVLGSALFFGGLL